MRWPSKYSDGFPGWHMECSAMSAKYLGEQFDIHGGGMDLQFPHHECEIAQSTAANGKESVKYWMHNNMITINGQKMGKSLGNFITLNEFFDGSHTILEQAYSPMTVRFFILQAHYRSTVDFSNEALQAAEKGLDRLMTAIKTLNKLTPSKTSTVDISAIEEKCYNAINDDLNTPIAISHLFDGVKIINSIKDGKEKISEKDLEILKELYHTFTFDVLGFEEEQESGSNSIDITSGLMDFVLDIRKNAKDNKDWTTSDKIRDQMKALGIEIKDGKDGAEWSVK